MQSRRAFILKTGAAMAAAGVMSAAHAQAFPSRPIQFIVPFPAGGSADILARMVGQYLLQSWGQPILVENKPGGGTVIGTGAAAKAVADGYTILFISNSFVINAKLRTNLPYKGLKAFEPVACMVNSPQVIAVSAASPHASLKDWIEAARQRPKALTMATLGPATTQHLAVELLQRTTGIQLTYVPFPGSVLAVNATLGGHVDTVLANFAEVYSHIDAGKLRPLAVTTAQRLDALKDVPTVAELGYPGYEAVAWFGVAAPAGTPKAAVLKLAEGINSAIADTEVLKKLSVLGLQPAYMDPAAFSAHIGTQFEQYARVIDAADIKVE